MNNNVRTINQLKVFLNTMNSLSADIICTEALNNTNRTTYERKIEESLLEKDQEKFMKYTNLLKELDNHDTH